MGFESESGRTRFVSQRLGISQLLANPSVGGISDKFYLRFANSIDNG